MRALRNTFLALVAIPLCLLIMSLLPNCLLYLIRDFINLDTGLSFTILL
jgi:hypothetical protein